MIITCSYPIPCSYPVVIKNQVSQIYWFSSGFVLTNLQLLHVYAKNYEGNGNLLLIRIGRYTLDGLVLAQVIFMGFVGINKLEVHLGLSAVMIPFTVLVKILYEVSVCVFIPRILTCRI